VPLPSQARDGLLGQVLSDQFLHQPAVVEDVHRPAAGVGERLRRVDAHRAVDRRQHLRRRAAAVTRVLAAGGAALVVAVAVFTITAFRTNPKLPISVRLAIRAGFVSLLAAQVTGALMIARGMILVFRGEPQEAYANGGILKPTHAVTMHGVLLLPALAWILSFTNFSERHRLHVVRLATCGYMLIVAIVGIANVRSPSLGEFPAAMLTLFAVGGMSILTAVGITLLGIASRHSRYDAERRSTRIAR